MDSFFLAISIRHVYAKLDHLFANFYQSNENLQNVVARTQLTDVALINSNNSSIVHYYILQKFNLGEFFF